jgi:hypothetical protein
VESQHPDPGSVIQDEKPESYFLELRNHFFVFFWVKILKFFDADPRSGMETVRIRDGKKSDPGSGSATLPKVYDAVGESYEVTVVFLHMSGQPDIDKSQDIGQNHLLKGGRELLILRQHLVVAGLCIRIHLMRIRIQHFFLICGSGSSSKSRVSMTKNVRKLTAEKNGYFLIKNCNLFIPRPL